MSYVPLFQTTVVRADQFDIMVTSAHRGDLIQAKNCVDYTMCGKTSTSLALSYPENRFHTYVSMDSTEELQLTLNSCHFRRHGLNVTIFNTTTHQMIPYTDYFPNFMDYRTLLPEVFLRNLTPAEKKNKYEKITALIKTNRQQEALEQAILEYGLPTHGFRFQSTRRNMGSAAAIIHHEEKMIEFVPFTDACELIADVRHELEHAKQIERVAECKNRGKSHNLSDHIARERSAYLNDIANITQYCPDPKAVDWLSDFKWRGLTHDYLQK